MKRLNKFGSAAFFAAITVLSSCGKNDDKKADGGVDAFGVSEKCIPLNTADSDAKTFLERTGPDAEFNLYWMGQGESVISFFTEKDWNIHFEVNKDPVSLKVLDANGNVKEEILCLNSLEEAKKCVENMNKVTAHINQWKIEDSKKVEGGAESLMTQGRSDTFDCSEDFLNRKIEVINAFITANTPVEETEAEAVVDANLQPPFIGEPKI